MKILTRLPVLCLAALALAPAAHAATDSASAKLKTVTGVRAFQLSASEGAGHEFARTPSFAWAPIRGAKNYEFELSTSKTFGPNSIIWSKTGLTTPAVAIPLALPWITGSPYSLYAHVRVTTAGGISRWSTPYGFNMRWPAVAKPMPSYPGLLRWTPVAGASGYSVWMVDVGHTFSVTTNVADEREYYTFHQQPSWSGVVHWRVRAERHLFGSATNGLPATSFGPWSPVYTSYNPPFQVGPLAPAATVSDIVTSAKGHPAGTSQRSHELTPAYVYNGNALGKLSYELYRVYVFTDRDCLNVVYKGAIVGSPAYAPRPSGPLGLPQDSAALVEARNSYLRPGAEGTTFSYDGLPVVSTESGSAATPGSGSGTGTETGGTGTGAPTDPKKTDTSPAGVAVQGARIDLWDNDWTGGGYYWTVVPVYVGVQVDLETSLAANAPRKATKIVVTNGKEISAGDTLAIDDWDLVSVESVDGNVITLTQPLDVAHGAGETVIRLGGGIEYRDAELTQDACAAARYTTFAKSSAPVTTSALVPYATGMSTNGRLIAARKARPVFYGTPLISWQPAGHAIGYEVQWSKQKYPWKAAGNTFTYSTSALLTKLTPGVWFYRVRGFDPYSMSTAKQMSWSPITSLQVAKPVFKLVS